MNKEQQERLESIQRYEALKRLQENEDFKLLISDYYLKDKILNSVSLLAVPSLKDKREEIIEDISAASNFNYFLHFIKLLGENALEENGTGDK
nr:MAG TPA: hypothetical protein [Caudoviricetes sp.]